MNRMHPQTLLLVLIGAVPLVVAAAGVAAFLLMRAGYGLLFWAVLPFLVSMLVIAALGVFLGRAARGRQGPEEPEPSRRRTGRRDGV
jgi:membrane protein implicated in regulation of membrane protease activity